MRKHPASGNVQTTRDLAPETSLGQRHGGERTREVLELLRRFESRNITFLDSDGSWPIVWKRARGNFVWDADGKRYLDLTAAFGVAAAGHANPCVVQAGQKQMATLLHAMGDVHPHALKARLAAELSRITFERWSAPHPCPLPPGGRGSGCEAGGQSSAHAKVIFCNSGFEAVEAALKTALLATGQRSVIAFEGGYHGLGYGALNVTFRDHFRAPFLGQLGQFASFVPFPEDVEGLPATEKALTRLLRRGTVGAVLVEPVQARGGIRVAPPGFLRLLRELCDRHGALMVLDEIYTGFGRTGRWFACEHAQIIPDVICLGKALTGGFPLSACVGRSDLMDKAWPPSSGEAIHTSTFLGHPVGCAMALAQIAEIRQKRLPERAAVLGRWLEGEAAKLRAPRRLHIRWRGLGLLAGLEIRQKNGHAASAEALELVKRMLGEGYILLPEGEFGNVIAFTPALTIREKQLRQTLHVLQRLLNLS